MGILNKTKSDQVKIYTSTTNNNNTMAQSNKNTQPVFNGKY